MDLEVNAPVSSGSPHRQLITGAAYDSARDAIRRQQPLGSPAEGQDDPPAAFPVRLVGGEDRCQRVPALQSLTNRAPMPHLSGRAVTR